MLVVPCQVSSCRLPNFLFRTAYSVQKRQTQFRGTQMEVVLLADSAERASLSAVGKRNPGPEIGPSLKRSGPSAVAFVQLSTPVRFIAQLPYPCPVCAGRW